MLFLILASCGSDPSAGDARAEQIRGAAEAASLPDDVVDVLTLAARGVDARFQVTYPGEGGAELLVSQAPPNRRIDVVSADRVVQSRVFRDGVGYLCAPPDDDPAGALDCTRVEGALQTPGAFNEEALETFASELGESLGEIDLMVESRTIAATDAICLVAVPKPGPTDGTGPGVETICLSPEGAQLLVDSGGDRLVATSYTTEVPEGTFAV